MGKISEKQYKEIALRGYHGGHNTPEEIQIMKEYHSQEYREIKRGIIYSGIVALVLAGSILISTALTPSNVKSEREIRGMEIVREMPYGIR